jgi:hypothetical protein
MPATTDKLKLPYPLPTDPIADGANQIKALAEKIDQGIQTLVLEVVKIRLTTDPNSSSDAWKIGEASAPIPATITTPLGAFCDTTYVSATNSNFNGFVRCSVAFIKNNKITIRGMSTGSPNSTDVNVLVWGYGKPVAK